MSHYPYRRAPPTADSQPVPGTYSSSDRNHPSADRDFYRQPHGAPSHSAPSSSSYPSSSSSRASGTEALSLLSSCGLEPDDLAALAKLPEDELTIESLPRLLKEIKGKKGASERYPSSSSRRASDAGPAAARDTASDWDHLRSQPVQYPLDHVFITPKPLPREQVQDWQDRWGNPRKICKPTSSAEPPPPSPSPSSSSSPSSSDYFWYDRWGNLRKTGQTAGVYKAPSSAEPPSSPSSSSSFSNYVVDYNHRGKSTEYDKKGRDGDRKPSDASYDKKSGSSGVRINPLTKFDTGLKMPGGKAARDFHGTTPSTFPYSCSLCDITVMSEKFWIQHINAPHHADGQLTLLQLFPEWDCRMAMETATRTGNQSEKPKDEGTPPAQTAQTASQSGSSYAQPNKKQNKKIKTAARSKVVCVKFPANSVDEPHLRKLTEPFGKIVKIIMFPSLAFVELGSHDQAKDLVMYYTSTHSYVQGENITFHLSNTFSFLQSSRVVSFTPAPSGDNGRTDLLSIAKRFGAPLYTLFLPSMAFVELKEAGSAQKLVDYYSTNTLKINDDIIKVAYSGEYNTLMRVSSAERYEEESSPTKRMRSCSPSRRDEPASSKRRRSREREERRGGSESRTRSSERRTRSRSSDNSSDKSSRDSRSPEKTMELDTTQQIKSKKADEPVAPTSPKPESSQNAPIKEGEGQVSSAKKPEEESSTNKRVRSPSPRRKEESASSKRRRSSEEREEKSGDQSSRDREKTVEPDTTLQTKTESKANKPQAPKADEPESSQDEEVSSGGESDIEGMAVIGEDGENLDNTDGEEEEEEEEEEKKKDAPEEDTAAEMEEPDFPIDLENCITLDEVAGDDSDDQVGKDRDRAKSPTSRVIYLRNLPSGYYSDSDFLKVFKRFGKIVRYFIIRKRQEGFIEMCSSSEVTRALKKLDRQGVEIGGYRFNCRKNAHISLKYRRLTSAWEVESDSDSDKEQRRERRSRDSRRDRRSRSKTSDRDKSSRKSSERGETRKKSAERKELALKTPEEIGDKKSPEEEDLTAKKGLEKEELVTEKTPENSESAAEKATEKEMLVDTNPSEQLVSEKILEEKLAFKKIPEIRLVRLVENEIETLLTPEKELEAEKGPEKAESVEKATEDEVTPKVQVVSPEEAEMEDPEQIRDKATEEESEQSEPAGGTVEPHKATRKASRKKPARGVRRGRSSKSKTLEEVVDEQTPEKEIVTEKIVEKEELTTKKTPEKEIVAETTPEDLGAEKIVEKELECKKTPQEFDTEKTCEKAESTAENSTEGEDTPKVQAVCPEEAEMEDPEHIRDEATEEQQPSEPAGGALEPRKPTKPVGTEFVRPVVGYFCNLCQVIYVDEDDAKQQHCSSLEHYRKYQEHTGKDPWTS